MLAKNQGLYNGFLVAGLVWGLVLAGQGVAHARDVETFFLACVIGAGACGAATVSPATLTFTAANYNNGAMHVVTVTPVSDTNTADEG